MGHRDRRTRPLVDPVRASEAIEPYPLVVCVAVRAPVAAAALRGRCCHLAGPSVVNLPGYLAGVSVMFVYGGVVLALRSQPGAGPDSDAGAGPALAFAAVSNMSALLLVLLPHEAQTQRIMAQQIDWIESLSVLGVVALMVGISFGVARHSHRRSY